MTPIVKGAAWVGAFVPAFFYIRRLRSALKAQEAKATKLEGLYETTLVESQQQHETIQRASQLLLDEHGRLVDLAGIAYVRDGKRFIKYADTATQPGAGREL